MQLSQQLLPILLPARTVRVAAETRYSSQPNSSCQQRGKHDHTVVSVTNLYSKELERISQKHKDTMDKSNKDV